jgi:hypothetical protein
MYPPRNVVCVLYVTEQVLYTEMFFKTVQCKPVLRVIDLKGLLHENETG